MGPVYQTNRLLTEQDAVNYAVRYYRTRLAEYPPSVRRSIKAVIKDQLDQFMNELGAFTPIDLGPEEVVETLDTMESTAGQAMDMAEEASDIVDKMVNSAETVIDETAGGTEAPMDLQASLDQAYALLDSYVLMRKDIMKNGYGFTKELEEIDELIARTRGVIETFEAGTATVADEPYISTDQYMAAASYKKSGKKKRMVGVNAKPNVVMQMMHDIARQTQDLLRKIDHKGSVISKAKNEAKKKRRKSVYGR